MRPSLTFSDDYAAARSALAAAPSGWLLLALDATGDVLQVVGSGATVEHLATAMIRGDFNFVLWQRGPSHPHPLLLYHLGNETPVARRSTLLSKVAEIARRLEPLDGVTQVHGLLAAEVRQSVEAATAGK